MQVGTRPPLFHSGLALSPRAEYVAHKAADGHQRHSRERRRRGGESQGSDKDRLVHSNPTLLGCVSFPKHSNPKHSLVCIKMNNKLFYINCISRKTPINSAFFSLKSQMCLNLIQQLCRLNLTNSNRAKQMFFDSYIVFVSLIDINRTFAVVH